jgi:hypothetical protein
VPALHASTAATASADMNIKLPHDHTRDRQFLLILRGDPRRGDRAATARTPRRERHVVPLVHLARTLAMGLRSIRGARFSAWSLGILRQRLRKRRRLPESRPSRLVQLSFEVVDPMTKSFGFPLQSVTLTSQRIALAFSVLGTLAPLGVGRSTIRVI